MQNRIFGPYLAAIHRILISAMACRRAPRKPVPPAAREKKRKRVARFTDKVTNVHMPELFLGAAPEQID
jgi:hypothetical protein